jgi:hypothetical protein
MHEGNRQRVGLLCHARAFVRYSRDYLHEEREAAAIPAGTVKFASLRGGGVPSNGRSNKLGHDAGSTTTIPKWARPNLLRNW